MDNSTFTDDDYWVERPELEATVKAYLPKPFAIASLVSSYVIIREITKEATPTPIHHLLVCIAVGDILFSFAYFLGTWPAPPDTEYYNLVHNVGSVGFCTFQGFLMVLGLVASVLSNACLSTYYLLIVRYGWKDADLQRRLEPYVPAGIWVVSLAGAIYPIPLELYNSFSEFCMIQSIPPNCTGEDCIRGSDPFPHIAFFALLPFLCLFVSLGAMCSIFSKVRQIEDTAEKYATSGFTAEARSSMTANSGMHSNSCALTLVDRSKSQAVARQALAYAAAFLVTYLLDFISLCIFLATEESYLVLDLIAYGLVLPSAGTFNFLVFARIRQMKTPEGRLWRSLLFCQCCRRLDTTVMFPFGGRSTRETKSGNESDDDMEAIEGE